ncbi:interferon gamma receptor 2 isoform X1 [Pan troglodytes]|uniref:interferon gamma receptor 2 isoform X1 n=1 Tax=Pan troglodytes TaxID=9598 RepID=UPI0007DB973C|nr:interferon gamma receptor 2 isoform X2 [Pan troglodytes]
MRPTLLWSLLLLLGVFAAAAAAPPEMGDGELACGGRNNGPQRCPRPHPQESVNLGMCCLTYKRDFADVNPLSQLPAPQHPKIRLYNAEQVLSWEPVALSNSTRPVVYRVQFKYTDSKWFMADIMSIGVNCTQITATECDFTAASPSAGFPMDFNVTLRLRAELGALHSAWVTMPWFQHYRNVTVGPPENIEVTPGEGSLIIRFSSPFDIADTSTAFFCYYVHYWEKGGIQQVKGPFRSNSISLDNLKPFRAYCLQVQAQLLWNKSNIFRVGHLSNISCYETMADASTELQQVILISVGTFSLLSVLAGACFFLVLKYRGLIKYWFHTPPSIPLQIEEYLKDPTQPILEALDKDSSPKDDVWDSVSIISFPEKEQEDVLQTL